VDWSDTPEQARFRAEVRTFIDTHLPERYQREKFDSGEHFVQWVFDRQSDDLELHDAARTWAHSLAQRGWVAPHWPTEYGGAGLSTIEQFVFGEEMARAHAPLVGGNGIVTALKSSARRSCQSYSLESTSMHRVTRNQVPGQTSPLCKHGLCVMAMNT